MGYDLFISYSHLDEKSPRGWVSQLEEELRLRVEVSCSRRLDIFRDVDLSGDEHLSALRRNHLAASRLLLCVVSPQFIRSSWCRSEVETFVDLCRSRSGTPPVFKVYKLPVGQEPEGLVGPRGYRFYGGPEDRPRELHHSDADYFVRLSDLAYDIHYRLLALEDQQAKGAKAVIGVFAAEERHDDYDAVRKELQDNGYRVLPHDRLSPLKKQRQKQLAELLERADLTLLLLGTAYSAELAELFAAVGPKGDPPSPPCIVTYPADPLEPAQARLVEQLSVSDGVDVLEGELDDVCRAIVDVLADREQCHRVDPSLYLIHDVSDTASAEEIRARIAAGGIKVISLRDAPQTAAFRFHRDTLSCVHGVLVYLGNATREFLDSMLNELRKSLAYGSSPTLHKAVYLSGPAAELPRYLQGGGEYTIIDAADPGSTALEEFLRRVRATAEAT